MFVYISLIKVKNELVTLNTSRKLRLEGRRPSDEVFTLENPYVSILLVSDDSGETWREQCIIVEEIDSMAIGFNETVLAYLGNDHIVAVIWKPKEGF